jgi:hypothetical protein
MMKSFILFVILIISFVSSTPDEATCKAQSNTTCDSCLKISGCAYCKNTEKCFVYTATSFESHCKYSDLQYQTCTGMLNKNLYEYYHMLNDYLP